MLLRKLILALTIVMTAPLMARAESVSHGDLMISDAMMRAVLPGGKVTAAYMVITNHGSQDDALTSVHYNAARKSEIHTMDVVNDVMKMRPIEGSLPIPAGQSVILKQGGLHLMFMGLIEIPVAGDSAALTLNFEQAGAVAITIPVKSMMGGHQQSTNGDHDGHNHDDHNHDDHDGHNHGDDHNHDH